MLLAPSGVSRASKTPTALRPNMACAPVNDSEARVNLQPPLQLLVLPGNERFLPLEALLKDADAEGCFGAVPATRQVVRSHFAAAPKNSPLELFFGPLCVVARAAESVLLPQKLLVLVVEAPLDDGHAFEKTLLVGRAAVAVCFPRLLLCRVRWVRRLGSKEEREEVVHVLLAIVWKRRE